jgi:hypothetical protein
MRKILLSSAEARSLESPAASTAIMVVCLCAGEMLRKEMQVDMKC